MAKFNDNETQSIAATVSDVLEGKAPKKEEKKDKKENKKAVKEVEQPRVPSDKNGPETGELDFKKKHKVKKVGAKADLDGTVYNKEETEEVTISIDEKSRLKSGKGKGKADIDYIGSKDLSKKLEKKYKIKIKPTGQTMADVMGDKKNLLNFLSDYMMLDDEDIEDLYPDVLEAKVEEKVEKEEVADEQTEKQKKYQEFFKKALKRFKVNSPAELDKEGRKKFFDYVDKNYDAGENEED